MNQFNLTYLHILEALPGHRLAAEAERVTPYMGKAFNGLFMVNGGYDAIKGAAAIDKNETDLVSCGVLFIQYKYL